MQERGDGEQKHVEFFDGFVDDADKESKLRRRDTPHYLKNKRTTSALSKEDAEAQVRMLLAKASEQRSTRPLEPSHHQQVLDAPCLATTASGSPHYYSNLRMCGICFWDIIYKLTDIFIYFI